MADLRLRINELPEELNPAPIDNIAIDGPSTRRTTLQRAADAVRPYSTEAMAREGLNNASVMTPLRVSQAIETLGGQRFATAQQGNKADSAVQPTLTISAGAGLAGGGTLAANREIALNSASIASLALANSAVQPARQVIAGVGLTGGGSLAADRTVSLDATTLGSLAKADSAVQPARAISAGTGLSGGGNLSADRTLALNAASIASLAKADSAVQPSRTVNAGAGLSGGGDLSTDRSLSLSAATQASLVKAENAIQSINGKTGNSVSITKSDVGLGNVDNTSDINKPVSTAQQSAIDMKVFATHPQGRLTLSSGNPVTEADIAGATTIYYTPSLGSFIPIYEVASSKFTMKRFSELALPLDGTASDAGYHQVGKNFDLFVINDGGNLKLVTGPSWSSDVERGSGVGTTDLEQLLGFIVNKNQISVRSGAAGGDIVSVAARSATYVGSFRAISNGQTSDTMKQRLLFNAYNRVIKKLYATDQTVSFNYSDAVWRQYNDDADNQIEILFGLSGSIVNVVANTSATSSTETPQNVWTAIGLGSIVPASFQIYPGSSVVTGNVVISFAHWNGYPGLGFHTLKWLQKGGGSDIQTWLGSPGLFDVGLSGDVAL